MELVLEIIKGQKLYINSYKFIQKSGYVGRSKEVDFTLDDSSNYISSKHIQVDFRDGFYFITDISTNGTYLKNPYRKLPKNTPIKINNSDIFIVGDYEIKAKLLDNEVKNLEFDKFSNLLGNNMGLTSKMLIPDDDFFLGNSNIMKNSFLKEDKLESQINNIIDIYEKKDNSILDILNTTKSVDKNEDIFIDETINNLNEHIEEKYFNLDVFDEGLECELEDEMEISNLPINTSSIEILEKNLGIAISSLDKDSQEKILSEISQIVINTLSYLKVSLDIKDKILNDLSLDKKNSSNADLNPIRKGKNEALNVLSNSKNEVILLSEAIKKSFTELDNHNFAIAKATQTVVPTLLKEFEVNKLENSFYKNYKFKSFIPKKFQLWDAYTSTYEKLAKNNQDIILSLNNDFSKEYANQLDSLKTTTI